MSNFEDYLKNEYRLAELYPSLYEGVKKLSPRGRNTIANMMTKLRVFYIWAVRMGETTTNPFANYSIKEQIYGRPYFLTLEERDRVYNLPMPNNPFLAIQRDIFVFQCMIGCRVSDLYRLTRENINDGAIEYVPTKTKGDNQEYARVPLTKKAIEILEKYKEYGGRTLFPFISEQKYNDSIKKILRMAGIDRKVTVINPVTQKEEQKPIYEIASSHLARRTFIGNIYKKVRKLIRNNYLENRVISVYYKLGLVDLMKIVDKNRFNIFYVLDDDLKVRFIIAEDELIEGLKIYGNISLEEYYGKR